MRLIGQWRDGRFNSGNIDISVTNRHIYNPGVWVVNVREFGWSARPIGVQPSATQEEAQAAAIQKVYDYLLQLQEEIKSYTTTKEDVLEKGEG